ncbi:MAG: Ig-like domain-containing protein [Candidatus Peregrinibacteria bacterium]
MMHFFTRMFSLRTRWRQRLVLGGTLLSLAAMSMTGVLVANAFAGDQRFLITLPAGSPATFFTGRCFKIEMRLQSDQMDTEGAEINLPYDVTKLAPYSDASCTSAATSALITGGAFPSYQYIRNTITGGTVRVSAFIGVNGTPVNTGSAPANQLLAFLYFKVLSEGTVTFDPPWSGTTDSNMTRPSGGGVDELDGVTSLTVTLAADTDTPVLSGAVPADGATGVSVSGTNLGLSLTDGHAGVNASSVTMTLNGIAQSITCTAATATNSNRMPSCTVTKALSILKYGASYTVTANGQDTASPAPHAVAPLTWSFRTEEDTDPPFAVSVSPASAQSGVSTTTPIILDIKDLKGGVSGTVSGTGVVQSSIRVTVTPAGGSAVIYTNDGAGGTTAFSASANADRSSIRVTIPAPITPYTENQTVTMAITAQDDAGNALSTSSFFTTVDTQVPDLSFFSPSQGATGIDPGRSIVFRVTDAGAGIDLSISTVTVAGIVYTGSSSPPFVVTDNDPTNPDHDLLITVTPATSFRGGQVVPVSISVRDASSPIANTATASYSFTIADTCTTCTVDQESPQRFQTDALLSDRIAFHVKDAGDGIDSATITATVVGNGMAFPESPITLTGGTLRSDGVGLALTGTHHDYTITITLAGSTVENRPYAIRINAQDMYGRSMATVGYTFIHLQQ